MASPLLAEMYRSGLRPLREAVTQPERLYGRDEVQQLLEACALWVFLAARIREMIRSVLENGVEGSKLTFLLQESAEAVRESETLFARVRIIIVDEAPPFAEKEHALAALDSARAQTEEVRKEFVALLEWLNSAPPQIPSDALLPRTGAPAEGYQTLDDILGRLNAGGTL